MLTKSLSSFVSVWLVGRRGEGREGGFTSRILISNSYLQNRLSNVVLILLLRRLLESGNMRVADGRHRARIAYAAFDLVSDHISCLWGKRKKIIESQSDPNFLVGVARKKKGEI